mgnify:CR=1 FL=1
MKKIPYNFIDKVAEAMNETCEVNNCEECIFYENKLCDEISAIVQRMACAIDNENRKGIRR